MPLDVLLARQAGVISREQAIGAGLTAGAVDHRLRLRRWRPVHPQVYVIGPQPIDDEVRARAAVLWAGEGAVLSGAAAAWWHGLLDRPPAVLALTVPARRPSRPRPGLAVRSRTLVAQDRDERRGLPVTAPPLTVLDAAVELGPAGPALLERALRRSVDCADVHAALQRAQDAPGAAAAARLLATAAARAGTAAERALVRLLHESGTRGWYAGFPLAGRRWAVAFPAARVVVHVVGWAWRSGEDHAPDTPVGWSVLRLDWPQITARPRAVLASIAATAS
jgi:hypothetical protein